MNDIIKNLMEQLRATSGGTKLIALMGGASFLAIIALVAVVSKKADLSATIFMNKNASEISKIAQALDEAGIEFYVSQSEPHFIQVDESDKSRAQAVAFASNALSSNPIGVRTESGLGGVFSSADEKGQVVDKLKEEEIELMLVALGFVSRASVRISEPTKSAIGSHRDKAMSVAVIVTVDAPPSAQQKSSLAALVTNSTGVDGSHVTISDQNGSNLYNGAQGSDEDGFNTKQMEYGFTYDERTAMAANEHLAKIYGPNMVSVMVKSEWNFEQSVERTETSADSVELMSTKNISSKATHGQGGGVPGLGAGSSNSSPQPETSEQTASTRRPLISRKDSVHNQPRLEHLAVSLTLHSDLKDIEQQLTDSVKDLVGFSSSRKDSFSSIVRDIYTAPVDESADVEEAEPTSAPNPMLETLMRRGVEVLTASIFILVLMKSLKSSSKPAPGEPGSPDAPEAELDMELLARANVDELVKTDPERVGEILTAWARGEQTTGAK